MLYIYAVKKYKKYLRAERGYSELTIKEYNMDLMLFYKYLINKQNFKKDFNVKKISKLDIAEFLGDIILEKDNSPFTRNRKLYSLKSFFKYLVKYEILEKDPTFGIESSKTRKIIEPVYLKLESAKKYIKTIKDNEKRHLKRNLAINKVFLYGGLRVSELVNLKINNINFDDNILKFYGKGNKERLVPLHQDVLKAINDYLIERENIKIKNKKDKDILFLSQQGKKITPRNIQIMVKKYAKLAGIKNASKITPHKLRHTFASIMYSQTKDIKVLQDLLGHSNISTTQIYTHTDINDKKNAINTMPGLNS